MVSMQYEELRDRKKQINNGSKKGKKKQNYTKKWVALYSCPASNTV